MILISSRRSYKVIPTIIMAGQSNMEGDTSGTPDVSIQSNDRALIFVKPNDASSTDNGWISRLRWGTNNNWRTISRSSVSPELSFAKAFTDAYAGEVCIIKYAYGGSALVDDGSSYVNGLWQVDANPANTNGLPHYSNMVNNFVIPCINKAKDGNMLLDLVAFAWCQGESDANSLTRSSNYEAALIALIDQLRTDLSSYRATSRVIEPIISRIHNNFSPARPYQNEVRTALENVAANYGQTVINTDSYSLGLDNIHFDVEGQKTHGEDIFAKFNTLL
jgi:hypothetical protein